eukprot:g1269.t1
MGNSFRAGMRNTIRGLAPQQGHIIARGRAPTHHRFYDRNRVVSAMTTAASQRRQQKNINNQGYINYNNNGQNYFSGYQYVRPPFLEPRDLSGRLHFDAIAKDVDPFMPLEDLDPLIQGPAWRQQPALRPVHIDQENSLEALAKKLSDISTM